MYSITINETERLFTLNDEFTDTECTFDEVLKSEDWIQKRVITITHNTVTEDGKNLSSCLSRGAFTDNMIHGDRDYMKSRIEGVYEYNTAIHKLYNLLEGKTIEEAEAEIENICEQRTKLDQLKREWNNEQVEKYAALEQALVGVETESEREKVEKKMLKIKQQKPPFLVSQEMKKMYYAARDESKPSIKFSNVTPELVNDSYGDTLTIQ